jgi:Ser/Thr protein kinase RdoA (MazF antagonist)
MSEELDISFIPPLVEHYYGVTVVESPELLHERDGQQVFRVPFAEGSALTLRLCTIHRPHERVLADTGALLFLNHAGFPAPILRLTVDGERVFQWQPGCWGYAQEYIAGENPFMDLPTLTQLGHMLGRLHSLASTPDDYPVQVGWLDELPVAIGRATEATSDPIWGAKAAEVAANLRSLPDLSRLPLGLIHTDVHEGNLLRSPDGQLYLLDWEDAGLDVAIFDLALVLGWNCVWQNAAGMLKPDSLPELYDFDEEYCRTLLGAYQQERPLSDLEIQMLGPAIRFVLGWFAARDIMREIAEPGVSDDLAFTNWAIMRSVTPAWTATLAGWATEMRPNQPLP